MTYQQELASHYHEVHQRLIGKTEVKVKKAEEKPPKPTPPPQPSPFVPKLSPLFPEIKRPILSQLVWLVCHKEGIALKDFASPRRMQKVVYARQIYFYLAHKYTVASLGAIAKKVGNRDHSTLAHGIRMVKRRIKELPQWADHINEYIAELASYDLCRDEAKEPCPFCGK